MAIEKHDFRKSETRIFFARGLDRPSRVENVGKLSISAREFAWGSSAVSPRHCEPTGRREAPPDDRLREAIQNENDLDCFVACGSSQ
jgi:hypothetical protein